MGVLRDKQATEEGAVVGKVRDGSPAAKAGIMAGDVIYRVNKIIVNDFRELAAELQRFDIGDEVPIIVLREGTAKAVFVRLSEAPPRPAPSRPEATTPEPTEPEPVEPEPAGPEPAGPEPAAGE